MEQHLQKFLSSDQNFKEPPVFQAVKDPPPPVVMDPPHTALGSINSQLSTAPSFL